MEKDIKYVILQQKYRKLHLNNNDIFPKEWYYTKEYELKKSILRECLDKKCLITETENYKFFKMKALN